MRFEEQVRLLCAQAIAARDEVDVRTTLAELRLVLHQRIELLRSGLQASFPGPLARDETFERGSHLRSWQRVVHEFTIEQDPQRAFRLSEELNKILRGSPNSALRRENTV
jgi:hypothetical protein